MRNVWLNAFKSYKSKNFNVQKIFGCLIVWYKIHNSDTNLLALTTDSQPPSIHIKYLELLCSYFVVDHHNIIVVEWKIAKYETIQGNSEGPNICRLQHTSWSWREMDWEYKYHSITTWGAFLVSFNPNTYWNIEFHFSRVILSWLPFMNRILSDVFSKYNWVTTLPMTTVLWVLLKWEAVIGEVHQSTLWPLATNNAPVEISAGLAI